eukprot:Rmarinus@m.20111
MDEEERKFLKGRIAGRIETSTSAVDLLLCVFSASLSSYRRGSILDPLPKFLKDCNCNSTGDDTDWELMHGAFAEIPSVPEILSSFDSLSPNAARLLDWASHIPNAQLVEVEPEIVLKRVDQDRLEAWQAVKPAKAYQVTWLSGGNQFEQMLEKYGCIAAFHGSKAENWYPILHRGLRNLSNSPLRRTAAAFGEGIYLSEELKVSLGYSNQTHMWTKSLLGDKIGIVAVCEVINHPDIRHGRRRTDEETPETYLIVERDELVRVTQLLVYITGMPRALTEVRTGGVSATVDRIRQLGRRHGFKAIIVAYLVILIVAAALRSRAVWRFIRRYLSAIM